MCFLRNASKGFALSQIYHFFFFSETQVLVPSWEAERGKKAKKKRMAGILTDNTPRMGKYIDRKQLHKSGLDEETFIAQRQERLNKSRTLWIGNLSFYTTEAQLDCMFGTVGRITNLVMGLNNKDRTPCGFAFIEYETHEEAMDAYSQLNHARIDDREVTVQWDDQEGVGQDSIRRWGRGVDGGQVVDIVKQCVDPGRGGVGFLRREAAGLAKAVIEEELVRYEWVPLPAGPRQQPSVAVHAGVGQKRPRR